MIKTQDEFKTFVEEENKKNKTPLGFGIARVDLGSKGNVLCATYPLLNWNGENLGSYAVFCRVAKKVISKSDSEAIFEVDSDFVNEALNLFNPFLAESLNNKQIHKNIQILL